MRSGRCEILHIVNGGASCQINITDATDSFLPSELAMAFKTFLRIRCKNVMKEGSSSKSATIATSLAKYPTRSSRPSCYKDKS